MRFWGRRGVTKEGRGLDPQVHGGGGGVGAQRLTVCISGSGGTGETPFHYRATSGKMRLRASGGAAVRRSRR